MTTILKTNDLTKKYGAVLACDRISIDVEQGDIYGLVGKNGAGKTTFIRLITGVANPTSGTFSLFGETNPKEIVRLRKDIAAMVETPSLYLDTSAYHNLEYRAILLGISLKEKPNIIINSLERVGLADLYKSNKKVKDFSLGMKQRLGIAVALMGNPKLLILDEPTNGLDPEGIKSIRQLLIKLNQELGITIIISSHILSELSRLATRYGFIEKGKLIKEATAEEIFSSKESKKEIIISTSDNMNSMEILKNKYSDINISLLGSEIQISNVSNSADIITTLFANKISVTSFREEETGLENYFLNLIDSSKEGK